ncbi:methyltransferase [Skermania sp. ID1734]|uniref:methyltransferase n=1 Tax=Skermania sp. ID1734 TaxID=2597516 RepID=UPI00351B9DD8
MRCLTSRGVFCVRSDGRFALNAMADPLRSDAAVSLRALARFIGSPEHREHWSHVTSAVRTGRDVLPAVRGTSFFGYTEQNPVFGAVFDAAMTSLSEMSIDPVLAAYDFSNFDTIVDVGGGHGRFLSGILGHSPGARGILFDLPAVVAGASTELAKAGVADRCTVIEGSFFDTVPTGGDAYVMKLILHDWADDKAVEILRNIALAAPRESRLLLIEAVIPEDNSPHVGKLIDIEMLTCIGGRERTAAEFRQLLRRGGFDLVRIASTASPISIVEAKPR